jgi:hypothetical protein
MAAQKLRKWAMLADFLVHFAGRCSDLDVYGLYALSRVGDVAKFQRVLSVAKLLRSQIDELVTTIKRETFCIPLSATFVAILHDAVDYVCVAPTQSSPRPDHDDAVSNSENDNETEEEAETEAEEEAEEEGTDYAEVETEVETEVEEEAEAEEEADAVEEETIAKQVSQISVSDQSLENDGSESRESSPSASRKRTAKELLPQTKAKSWKRRRQMWLSSSSSSSSSPASSASSLKMPPAPSLTSVPTTSHFRNRLSLGFRKW